MVDPFVRLHKRAALNRLLSCPGSGNKLPGYLESVWTSNFAPIVLEPWIEGHDHPEDQTRCVSSAAGSCERKNVTAVTSQYKYEC